MSKIDDVSSSFKLKDAQDFISALKQKVNIVKKEIDYNDDVDILLKLVDFLNANVKITITDNDSFINKNAQIYAFYVLAENILDINSSQSDSRKKLALEITDRFKSNLSSADEIANFSALTSKNIADSIKQGNAEKFKELMLKYGINSNLSLDDNSKIVTNIKFSYDDEIKFKNLVKDTFNKIDKAIKNIDITESKNKYNMTVLRRRVPKKKIVNESEFLKKEFKRLWKL